MGVSGLMPIQWNGAGGKSLGSVRSIQPAVCAGCGSSPGESHPWLCPVLIRLSAQLLFTCDSVPFHGGWRNHARRLADEAGNPWCRVARHWRAVAAEPDPLPADSADEVDTPDLIPDPAGGMREVHDFPGCSRPGSAAILTPQMIETLNRAFGSGRWELCPAPFDQRAITPPSQDESP